MRISDWSSDVCSSDLLSEAEEREHIRRAVASLERTTGTKPPGWYCRHGPSVNTRRLLVEHGGFLYDSDSYDDELPCWTRVGETSHLVVPYRSEEHTSELQSLMRTSCAVFCLKKK